MRQNFLDLKVSKTKELIINFGKTADIPKPSTIHGEDVEIVDNYKFLGTVLDSQLKFDANTESTVKQGQQRIHLLRKLNSFKVSDMTLNLFYQSFIESLLTFSFICWFNGLSMKDRNSLNGIVKVCSKIIGVLLRDPCSLQEKCVTQKVKRIISRHDHVLASKFSLMPSSRCYKMPLSKTNRHLKPLIPSAIRLLNLDSSLWK